ncbi:hypothetical protein HPP92_006844 [Vanilla planifolia]|uniref:Uncharacterized protein n=1 Tax=Vanilla planifolia TaxID=51239 RepID=A0A835RCW8_VANPL|nr:hypothetical protein HPP92_006844 [Vanilla planifolia]
MGGHGNAVGPRRRWGLEELSFAITVGRKRVTGGGCRLEENRMLSGVRRTGTLETGCSRVPTPAQIITKISLQGEHRSMESNVQVLNGIRNWKRIGFRVSTGNQSRTYLPSSDQGKGNIQARAGRRVYQI